MKADLHNYSFIEEDTFELNLMDESYGYSAFIDKQLSHRFTRLNGYPALESKYRHKDGSFSTVKYIIRGPVYYAVIAHHKNDNPAVRRFIESFCHYTIYLSTCERTHRYHPAYYSVVARVSRTA
jgi:hypothetical protein